MFGPQPVEAQTCNACNRLWDAWKFRNDPKDTAYSGALFECCPDCRRVYVNSLWQEASTWAQVVFPSYSFLRGRLWSTPLHRAPLCEESAEINPGFQRLHEYGIITNNSQPYMREIQGEFECFWRKTPAAERFHEYVQRPFLEVSMPTLHPDVPKEKVEDFVHRLLNHYSVDATVCSELDKYPHFADKHQGRRQIKALDTADPLYSLSSSSGNIYPSTFLTRNAPTAEKLEATPWQICEGTPGRLDNCAPFGPFRFILRNGEQPICSLSRKMKTLCLLIYAKAWHVDLDIQAVVEQVCIDAGLKRIFHDIDGWINIPADDPAHASLILEYGGYIGYENKTVLFPDGGWTDREYSEDCHTEDGLNCRWVCLEISLCETSV
jgi:hypothetical protein